jgi:hypothetical protein
MVIVLIKNAASPFARWKLLSFNDKGTIALPAPYISPLIASMHVRSLLNLLFPLAIAAINNPLSNLIKPL